jgi:nitroimidazol reductase NimA-like FMN-containing flavoprotein (pyridoxamine 5'-phosphate oxidase superfamily)
MAADNEGKDTIVTGDVLSRSECLFLLAARSMGRVAVSRRALPTIQPVNYALLGEDILFATGTGSMSLAIGEEVVIAFEVDDVDPATRSGWSIVVVGKARKVDELDSDSEAARCLNLDPWVGRHAIELVRLPTDRLTGRWLHPSQDPSAIC